MFTPETVGHAHTRDSGSCTHQRQWVQDGRVLVCFDLYLLLVFTPPVDILWAKHLTHQFQQSGRGGEGRGGEGRGRGSENMKWVWVCLGQGWGE